MRERSPLLNKMEKIKPLLPSLREKKRYVAFEIISKKNINFLQASKTVFDAVLKYTGIKGLAEMGLIILKEKFNKNKGVLRVNTKKVDSLKSSLVLIKEIDKIPVIFKTLRVSGVLKKTNQIIS